MAGSYQHCCGEDGAFIGPDDFVEMIENLGDAHEACEMMHFMIGYLARGAPELISQAEEEYWEAKRAGRI